MRAVLTLFTLLFLRVGVSAAGPFFRVNANVLSEECAATDSSASSASDAHISRALAAALAITVGPFGGHRLYLGTSPVMPLIYAVTFGGFGILVLIDIGHILFTDDLSAYQNSRRVFMWARPRSQEPIPP